MDNASQDWKGQLQELINSNNAIRVNGKVASHKTQSDRASFLFNFFIKLRAKGYKTNPRGLKRKHIAVMFEEYESRGLSSATLQTYMMHLRVFERWIGKQGMIGDYKQYFKNPDVYKRVYVAQEDKSWSGSNIDIETTLANIYVYDQYFYFQLLIQSSFGLRVKEAIRFAPLTDFIANGMLHVKKGKGGRERFIPIESEFQIAVKKELLGFVKNTTKSLIPMGSRLEQEYSRYFRNMKKFGLTKAQLGVTGHGLRHEYIHAFMRKMGLEPTVTGGELNQLPKEEEKKIRQEAALRLGHNRIGISTAYYGPSTKYGMNQMHASKKN